jgi:hypothetical protein
MRIEQPENKYMNYENMPENEQSNLKQRNPLGVCSDIHKVIGTSLPP